MEDNLAKLLTTSCDSIHLGERKSLNWTFRKRSSLGVLVDLSDNREMESVNRFMLYKDPTLNARTEIAYLYLCMPRLDSLNIQISVG